MTELSLNILDIAQNSISAGAKNIEINLTEDRNSLLIFEIKDDGSGMSKEIIKTVTDPFYTTRTTRKVGMGIPMLKMEAEQTGGSLCITSSSIAENPEKHGTILTATFYTNHIDCIPLGNIIDTICTLLQGSPELEFEFNHVTPDLNVTLSTKELKEILGDVSLAEFDVLMWIKEYLAEQYTI